MRTLYSLVKRNTKLFFKDKGMFFTSIITPLILLVLYATFLGNVYRDSFETTLGAFGITAPEELIAGCVSGQLFSSLLAVSCVTVAFCSNLLMVQDKVNGSRYDLTVSPVKTPVLSFSYYISTAIATLIVSLIATAACLIYVAAVGWFLSFADILLIIGDVILLVLFGTALSGLINIFLSSQGQISAVGTIVSAGYGFICGAYMPLSQFSDGLRNALAFLPGTYGTSLLRNHALRGVFEEMESEGYPTVAIDTVRDIIDCNIYFFDEKVPMWVMYAVLCVAVALLFFAYVLITVLRRKAKR